MLTQNREEKQKNVCSFLVGIANVSQYICDIVATVVSLFIFQRLSYRLIVVSFASGCRRHRSVVVVSLSLSLSCRRVFVVVVSSCRRVVAILIVFVIVIVIVFLLVLVIVILIVSVIHRNFYNIVFFYCGSFV